MGSHQTDLTLEIPVGPVPGEAGASLTWRTGQRLLGGLLGPLLALCTHTPCSLG